MISRHKITLNMLWVPLLARRTVNSHGDVRVRSGLPYRPDFSSNQIVLCQDKHVKYGEIFF